MKIVKKSLIVASTLALGLVMTGCNKKNVNINKDNIIKTSSFSPIKSAYNQRTVRVKSYSKLSERFVQYKTVNDETVVYDVITNKEIYTTSDKVYSISLSIEKNLLSITFDDEVGSRMVVSTNGKTLVEKGNYSNLVIKEFKTIEKNKKDNFEEIIFGIVTKKATEDSVAKFYKLTTLGVKNYKGKLITDITNNYTIEEITEKDVIEYKKGDLFPKNEKDYSYNINGNNITFYEMGSKKVVANIKAQGYQKFVFVLKDKALVQLINQTDNKDNYDASVAAAACFNITTYEVDLKSGSYKEIKNFKYMFTSNNIDSIFTSEEDDYPKYYYINNAVEIKNKTMYKVVNICIDNNAKVVLDNQKYVYNDNSYYYDLGNGNYLKSGYPYVYLTDKNGIIKKAFYGSLRVLLDAKVFALYNSSNGELFLVDFKGNYVIDQPIKYSGSIYYVDNTHFYYTSVDNKNHLVTLDNGKMESDVVVDYVVRTNSSISMTSTVPADTDRYYSTSNFYFTASIKDINGDNVKDCYDLTYYKLDGEKLYELNGITSMTYSTFTNVDGRTSYMLLSVSDRQTSDFSLSIDVFEK